VVRALLQVGAMLRRLIREPLVHFCLLGGLVFAVDRARHPPAPARDAVRVDAAVRDGLRGEFARRNGREPTGGELRAMVDGYVEDELLYREALALGLDRGDPIVRRRLVQKLELTLEDVAAARDPTDAELAALLREEPARWERPPSTSLTQVFVRGDGPAGDAAARDLLRALEGGADPRSLGEPFIAGATLAGQPDAALDVAFAPGFAAALRGAPAGRWVGPLRSRYGLHLVRVDARAAGAAPALAEVRDALRARWFERARDQARREALTALRARYRVEVTPPPPRPAETRVASAGEALR
jgi:peptidyl-prolyl cis-trans isomerase C